MSGLAEVLARHGGEWTWNGAQFPDDRPILCGCGWQGCIADHDAHLAAAVVDWLTQRLGEDDVREAVEAACLEGLLLTEWGPRYRPSLGATAALAAIAAALRGDR